MLQSVIYDADGDTLTYSWRVKEGALDSDAIPTPTWTVPIDTGFAAVMLTVDDGVNTPVSESVLVQVVHALIVPGKEAAGIKLGDRFDRMEVLYGTPSRHNRDFFCLLGYRHWVIGFFRWHWSCQGSIYKEAQYSENGWWGWDWKHAQACRGGIWDCREGRRGRRSTLVLEKGC